MATASKKVDFEPLGKDNYQTWINHVKDYLNETECMAAFDASELTGDEVKDDKVPGSFDYVEPDHSTKKMKTAWHYVRKHLSDEVYGKTLQVTFGNLTELLRLLRLEWHDQGTMDRANLRDIYNNFKLEDYSDFDAYKLAFTNHVQIMKKYQVGCLGNDEDILYKFQQGLPDAWDTHSNTVLAQGLKLDAAMSYYKMVAKRYSNLPGSTARSVRKQDKVLNTTEVCRNYAQGKCKRSAADCRYLHVDLPQSNQQPNSTQEKPKFKGKCNHCGKTGHKAANCFKKKNEEDKKRQANKPRKQESAQAAESNDPEQEKPQKMFDSVGVVDLVFTGFDTVDPKLLEAVAAMKTIANAAPGCLRMLFDGGSTALIVQDPANCSNVRNADITIKVGGGLVKCTKIGDFHYQQLVNNTYVRRKAIARICPNFGFDILPEAHYLAAGCKLEKEGEIATMRKDGRVLLKATKAAENWLYFADVQVLKEDNGKLTTTASCATDKLVNQPRTNLVEPVDSRSSTNSSQNAKKHNESIDESTKFDESTPIVVNQAKILAGPAKILAPLRKWHTGAPVGIDDADITFCTYQLPEDGEESLKLLPFDDLFDFSFVNRTHTLKADEWLTWHKRLGHRNWKDVSTMLGLPLPDKLPLCTDCIMGKSTRHPLGERMVPVWEAPRPGYAFSCDHIGPFRVLTLGGNAYCSVKMDICSKRLYLDLTKSVSTFPTEWNDLVNRVEAETGNPRAVAQLITDKAPWFVHNEKLHRYNANKGIIHCFSPAYTQSLNPVERRIRTLVEMVRTMMIGSGVPAKFHGYAFYYAAYVLNNLPYEAGGRVTCMEKWYGKLLPGVQERLHTFGCLAFKQLSHPTAERLDYLDPRSEPHVFLGVNENSKDFIVATIPHYKISDSAHLHFVEDVFPCKSKLLATPTGPDKPFDVNEPMPLRRSARGWMPSSAQLENLASGQPSPPEPPEAKHDELPARQTRGAGEESSNDQPGDMSAYMEECQVWMTDIDSGDAPKTLPDALKLPKEYSDKWRAALVKEYEAHVKNGTLGPPCILPTGYKAVPLDVVLKIKRDDTFKVRAIVKGFLMKSGLDYNETFAPVPNIATFRILLALATKFDWEIWQGDVRTAFLGAEMDAKVYARVPNWFSNNPDATGFTIRQILKAVNGVPQGPRLWYRKSAKIFAELGLKQCKCEYALFHNDYAYLLVWVDDYFLFFPTQALDKATQLWKALQKRVDLEDAHEIDDCLGCLVVRDRKNRIIKLTQQAAIEKLLLRAGMSNCTPADTPMVAGLTLSKQDCPEDIDKLSMMDDQKWYRSIVASIIYFVSWTRPEIALAVSRLCRYMHNPGKPHLTALKRLLRFLRGTANVGLVFDFSTPPPKTGAYGYYDASHADCIDTRRSTLCYIFFFEGCVITWHTKLHSYVTTSTNHSEYCAAAKAAKEAKWLENVFTSIGMVKFVRPIHLFSDSQGAISMTYNPTHRAASKHIDLADHYVREQQERGTITVTFVPTKEMIADIGTKPLGATAFL